MKKLLLIFGVLLALFLVAAIVIAINFNSIIKRGVESAGLTITQVPVKLAGVNVQPLAGSGAIKGLVVGNPPGYKSASAISVGEASLELVPKSVMADKVVVRSLVVRAPEISLEGSLQDNNLTKIMANIDKFTASEKKDPAASGSSKRLQVDEFIVSNAKVNVNLTLMPLGQQQAATVTLPEIRLTNLGQSAEGITSGELTRLMFDAVIERVLPAVAASLSDLSKGTPKALQDATRNPEAAKGIGDLLKQKK